MTLNIEALLSRMTYQPNVEIEYNARDVEVGYGHPALRICMWVLDARQTYPRDSRDARRLLTFAMQGAEGPITYALPSKRQMPGDAAYTIDVTPQKISQKAFVPWQLIEQDNGDIADRLFYDWLDSVLEQMMKHEHREWFQVDGKPYNDPHPPKPTEKREP